MYIGNIHLLVVFYFLPYIHTKCNDSSKNMLFITDYVKWKKMSFMILLDINTNYDCNLKMVKENLNTFVSKNIYFAIHSSLKFSETILNHTKEKTAVVSILDSNFTTQDFLDQANKIAQYGEKVSWLILAGCHLPLNIMDILRYANFGLDSDVVVACETHMNNTSYQVKFTNNTVFKLLAETNESFLPFKNISNQTTLPNYIDCCKSLVQSSNVDSFDLYQVYKIRKTFNTSLVVHGLGVWDSINLIKNLKPFWDLENRGNFYQFPIIVGYYEVATEGVMKENDIDLDQRHFVNYFVNILNSSKTFLGYLKLGHRENGEWTDLLNAIHDEDVDISGQGISKNLDRINDMSYSFDILKNSRNIYIEPEESEILRDIFLRPFDSRLILCVVGIGLILAVAFTLNNFINSRTFKEMKQEKRNFSESVVWCVGIFSQQGSIWRTRSVSEKIIVIISLFLTMVIYNSYSAFITSVLSVKLNSIRNVHDLLESDYKIVYAKDSQDEDYLRSVNISELKQIYLRGYLQNDVINISEGLNKVVKGDFALFASGQVARSQLLSMTKYKCKFDIDEIKIHDTAEYMGFVMSKKSTFKRLINLSLIKMYETGVYRYIYSIIYPDLIHCEKPIKFKSARLADLSTAFFVVIFGWGASFVFLTVECFWKKRDKIYRSLKKRITTNSNINSSDLQAGNINMNNDFRRNMQYNTYYKFGNRTNLILPPIEKNYGYLN